MAPTQGAIFLIFNCGRSADGTWAAKPRWSGGGFTRVVVELADLRGPPARAIARQHKIAVERWLKGNKAAAPSISQLTAGYGRPTRAGAREGRCACGDDGEHLQSTSALTLDRRRDLSELRFSA